MQIQDFKIVDDVLVSYTGTEQSVVIPECVSCIGEQAFCGCDKIKTITANHRINEIRDYAFSACKELESFYLAKSPKKIGTGIFTGCNSLYSIRIGGKTETYIAEGNCIIHKTDKVLVAGCKDTVVPPGLVKKIAPYAFRANGSITGIFIPEGVTAICEFAFANCSALSDLHLPFSLRTIEKYAFAMCTSLVEIPFVNGITELNESAFGGCERLAGITIPETLSQIYGNPFVGCVAVKSVKVHRNNPVFRDEGNCIISKEDGTVISGFSCSRVPESATAVGRCAFSGISGITTLELPDGIKKICSHAYSDSQLKKVIIGENIAEIETMAFGSCKHLEYVEFKGSGTVVQKNAFDPYTNAAVVAVRTPVTNLCGIEEPALLGFCEFLRDGSECEKSVLKSYISFAGRRKTRLAEMSYGNMSLMTFMARYGIYGKKLAERMLERAREDMDAEKIAVLSECVPNTSDDLDFDFFDDDFLEEKSLSELKREWNYERLPDKSVRLTLYKGNEAELYIPKKIGASRVSEIGDGAFRNYCEITFVSVPEGVQRIGNNAFENCINLTWAELPSSLESIGNKAFCHCERLKDVEFYGRLRCIGDHAFLGCGSMTSVSIPDSCTVLGVNPFAGCTGLEDISVSKGNDSYAVCKAGIISTADKCLVSVFPHSDIPDDGSVLSIGQAFAYNSKKTSICIPDCITAIGCNAFEECANLRNVTLSEGMTFLPAFAFSGCRKLETVTIPGSITDFGVFAFDGCDNVTLVAPEGSPAHEYAIENFMKFEAL